MNGRLTSGIIGRWSSQQVRALTDPLILVAIALAAPLALAAAWLLGDFLYSRVVARRYRRWEAAIVRDDEGVRKDCGAFTVEPQAPGETALLLVHGFNDSPFVFRKIAPLLAEKGIAARAMRLPGYGESLERSAGVKHEQWLEAIAAELAALRQQFPRVAVLGFSLGGTVAIRHLLDHPRDADAAVLIAPAVGVGASRSFLFPARVWHRLLRPILIFTLVVESPFPNDAHDPAEREYPMRMRFTPRAVLDEAFKLIDSVSGRAADLRTPLLMVLSRDDRVIDWRKAEEFFHASSANPKRLEWAADAGHMIPIDYGWRELAELIADYVRA